MSIYSRAKLHGIPALVIINKKAEVESLRNSEYSVERTVIQLVRELVQLRAVKHDAVRRLFGSNVFIEPILNDIAHYIYRNEMLVQEANNIYVECYVHTKMHLPDDVELVLKNVKDWQQPGFRNFPTALSKCLDELFFLRIQVAYLRKVEAG